MTSVRYATLGELIRVQRRQWGWTQAQLAEEVGVSDASVSAWENDRHAPDIEQRKYLYNSLIKGNPEAVEAWNRLLAVYDGGHLVLDPLTLIRPFAKPGLLSVLPSGAYQGIGRMPSDIPRF